MFSTEEEAQAWIDTYAENLGYITKKPNKFWKILGSDGFFLTDEEIDAHESKIDG